MSTSEAMDIECKEEVLRCPNGCELDELELGKEGESFSSVIGIPFQYVRCGKCMFNDGGSLSNSRNEAIVKWNAAVRAGLEHLQIEAEEGAV